MAALKFVMEHDPGSQGVAMLGAAIEAYEKIHFPIAEPTPEEAAAFRREQGGPICERQGHMPVPTEDDPEVSICGRCGQVLRER